MKTLTHWIFVVGLLIACTGCFFVPPPGAPGYRDRRGGGYGSHESRGGRAGGHIERR